MQWGKRAAMVLLAMFFMSGAFTACGPKAKIGESCKRHSQCESQVCGSDMKCHTKESDRKLRTSKKKRGE